MIEAVDSLIDRILRDMQEVGALGEVLTQQAVGVLVKPTLPRVIWVGKVDLCRQPFGNVFMLSKLLSVVKGDGVALRLMGPK